LDVVYHAGKIHRGRHVFQQRLLTLICCLAFLEVAHKWAVLCGVPRVPFNNELFSHFSPVLQFDVDLCSFEADAYFGARFPNPVVKGLGEGEDCLIKNLFVLFY